MRHGMNFGLAIEIEHFHKKRDMPVSVALSLRLAVILDDKKSFRARYG